jgi:hypothetical protein
MLLRERKRERRFKIQDSRFKKMRETPYDGISPEVIENKEEVSDARKKSEVRSPRSEAKNANLRQHGHSVP